MQGKQTQFVFGDPFAREEDGDDDGTGGGDVASAQPIAAAAMAAAAAAAAAPVSAGADARDDDVQPLRPADGKTWWDARVQWAYALSVKYRRAGLSMHFAFISCTAIVVLAIVATVQTSEDTSASSIAYSLAISLVSVIVYTYGAVAILFRGMTKRLAGRWYSRRRTRFWLWLSFNLFILINWACITAIFYLPQANCQAAGGTVSWWPWASECSKVYNMWAWSIWNIMSTCANVYFVVADELDVTQNGSARPKS